MTDVFADAFYYFALLDRTDPYHSRVESFVTGHFGGLVTTDWVLTEVADGLAHSRSGRSQFRRLYRDLTAEGSGTMILRCDPALFDDGIDLYSRRPDKEWSLTDCISFVVMSQRRIIAALTGDHHFEQAGFVALLK